MPPGLRGELCIGGKGLSKGYINNQSLTEEKFVEDILAVGKKCISLGIWQNGCRMEILNLWEE